MIASAMSRRSRRAAGPAVSGESRAFLASRSTIYLDDACGSSRDRWTCDIDYSMTQGRTGDPKTKVGTSGIIGIGTIDRAKQHRAEAAPGPDGDDNGPGSEPPPHGRFRYVSTFVTSRRRPQPSFTYFPVDCLPHDVLRPDEPTDLREGDLPDGLQRRSKDPKTSAQTAGNRGLGPYTPHQTEPACKSGNPPYKSYEPAKLFMFLLHVAGWAGARRVVKITIGIVPPTFVRACDETRNSSQKRLRANAEVDDCCGGWGGRQHSPRNNSPSHKIALSEIDLAWRGGACAH
ncbi:hypothetical protein THAOC_21702 [Thalassiosira oceanica]|uniref:Uncharacterized protein n=1 Tax=Thalassiosira oceanica TaxID=159749 RepID=K0RYX5_THAOC|nr:hypothetical protein THAOC_21702 [Thalassiosira oceanica]|eukprot:EJK58195.1 hypothetical protein THAOC_21702 [Thalassiosira oceanica]